MNGRKPHLEYALLGLLAGSPAHGYELYKKLKDLPSLGSVWYVKQANLYALLDKLEAQGLISSRQVVAGGYPPRKEYTLTLAGEKVFRDWLSAPVDRPRELRQEFLLRLYFACQDSLQAARELLDSQRRALHRWRAEVRQTIAGLPGEETFQALVLEYRLRQLQAALDWLDWCQNQPIFQT